MPPLLAIAIPIGLFEAAVVMLMVVVYHAMKSEEDAQRAAERQVHLAAPATEPAARAA